MHRELLFDFSFVPNLKTSEMDLWTRIISKTIITIIGIAKVLTLLAGMKGPIRIIDLVFLIPVAIGWVPIVITNALTRARLA